MKIECTRPIITRLLLLIVIIAVSCDKRKGAIRKDDDAADHQNCITVAERLTIERTDSCTKVIISDPWQGAAGVRHVYYLVKNRRKLLVNKNEGTVINVPVKRIICMSTTHAAMIGALGETRSIVGISGTGYIYSDTIRDLIRDGKIRDVGYDSGMNTELIIKISPDLIMMYGIGSESEGYIGKIKELGYNVMFNADYLETDPLGKAEWIKLFSGLFCREKAADSLFSVVSGSYLELKRFISENAVSRPTVMLGMPFRDTWFVSPGNSYISRLISDAGGRYLWQEIISDVSMPFSLENVFLKARDADFWLNTGTASSKSELLSFDSRFAEIKCFNTGNLFNNNKRLKPEGGNDYWESGALYPHLVLRDIASILHPGLFREHELVFYRELE